MSNTTAEINGFFRPSFYTPANGEKATHENIRKAYNAQDPKPSTLKTISPAVYTGLGVTVLGLIGSIFGFTKENSVAKWLGSGLAVIGLGLAGVGKFTYGVDFKAEEHTPVVKSAEEKPVEPAEPPAAQSPSYIPSEEEQRLLKVMEDPQEDFTKRTQARSSLSSSKVGTDEKKKFDEMVLRLKEETHEEVEILAKQIKESKSSEVALDKLIFIATNKRIDDSGRLKAVNLLIDYLALYKQENISIAKVDKIMSTLFKCYVEKELISNGASIGGELDCCSLVEPLQLTIGFIDTRLRRSMDKVNDYDDLVAEVTPFTQEKGNPAPLNYIVASILDACKNPLAIKARLEHLRLISQRDDKDVIYEKPLEAPQYNECIEPLTRLIESKLHSTEKKEEIRSILKSYLNDPNQLVNLCANELIKDFK